MLCSFCISLRARLGICFCTFITFSARCARSKLLPPFQNSRRNTYVRLPNVRKSVELQKFLQYIVCGTSGLQFFISAALKTWRISFYRMRRTHGQNAYACSLTKLHAHAVWSRDTLHGYIRRTKAHAKEEREPSHSLFLFRMKPP